MATKTNLTKPDPATVLCDGFRSYIARKLGGGYSEDELHEVFAIAEQAIRTGNLRDTKRLMGYLRTVVRIEVTARIREIIQRRREQAAADRALHALAPRDQEILARFYLREQSANQICSEMGLPESQYRLFKSRAMQRFSAAIVPAAA